MLKIKFNITIIKPVMLNRLNRFMYNTLQIQLFFVLFVLVILASKPVSAESLYDVVEQGNKLNIEGKHDEALQAYIGGQVEHPENETLKYNIASTKYKSGDFEGAIEGFFDVAATSKDPVLEQQAYYNLGNSHFRTGKLQESVEFYKKALELNPEDQEAKFNLEFVREEIKRRINEQKKQQQNQNKQCDNKQKQNQDKNQQQKDQQNKDQQKKDEQNKKDQQDKQQQQKEEEKPQQAKGEKDENQPKQDEGNAQKAEAKKMSKEELERWLQTLDEDQKEMLKKQAQKASGSTGYIDKDW